MRFENDLKILNLHTEELHTVPSQLNFDKFPEPFLKHNQNFVNEYNKLIQTFQIEVINLIKRQLNFEINLMNKDLKHYKYNLKDLTDNVEAFVENIHKQEEEYLSSKFLDADNKARRVIMKPYLTSSKQNYSNLNNKNSYSYNQNNNTNGAQNRLNNANFHNIWIL